MAKKKTPKPKAAKKKPAATDLDAIQEQVEKLLKAPGTEKKVKKLLLSLTEDERRSLAPKCQKHFREIRRNDFIEGPPGTFKPNPLKPSADMAAFCTGNLTEIKKMSVWHWPSDSDAAEILVSRDPKMIPKLIDMLLKDGNSWHLIRYFVREKLCPKPDHPRYYTGMIAALKPTWRSKETVIGKLRKDPDLLKDDIWKLFEYEGEGDRTLANIDRWDKANWSGALVTLSKEGKLSRNRLLDSAIGALELGFNHYRARWFFDFFDLLKPTNAELKKRANRILGLIDNPAPNVAQWAFDKQTLLLKNGLIKDPTAVIEASTPLLGARAKKTVVQVLKLFADLIMKSPKVASHVCIAATEALAHEKADVQKTALKLIKTHGSADNAELREAVEKYAAVASATVTKDVKAWLEGGETVETKPKRSKSSKKPQPAKSAGKAPSLGKVDAKFAELMSLPALLTALESGTGSSTPIPAAVFDGTDFPRLDPDKAIEPIADFDELIESLGRVIEDDCLPDEAERAIAGLARLHADKPADFEDRIAPLFKRAKKLLDRFTPFCGQGYVGDICALICAWVRGEAVSTEIRDDHWSRPRLHVIGVLDEPIAMWEADDRSLSFMSTRLLRLCQNLPNEKPIELLSAPTHAGGWISAHTLVQRVNSAKTEADKTDVILALLRLAPDGREAALKNFKPKVKGEWVSAIKHGLGGSGVRIGKTAALWAAAARCRNPCGDDAKVMKAFPKLGPGTGAVAKFTHEFSSARSGSVIIHAQESSLAKSDANLPTQLLQLNRGDGMSFHDIGTTPGSIKWLATLWPSAYETFFAAGASCIGGNLDWWEAAWHNRCFLEPLLDSDVPLGAMGELMLLCGLAAKEPGEHGLATDIGSLAIEDGRLGTDNLGRMLAEVFSADFFNLPRVAKRLTDVAAASELHAYVVMHACETGLPALHSAAKPPRGIGDILELMAELGTQLDRPISSDSCRDYLKSLKGSSKPAKAAKLLLALDGQFTAAEAINQAVRSRTDRIKLWSERN